MNNVVKLAVFVSLGLLSQTAACQGEARVISEEFQICMDSISGADMERRSVVDVDLVDVTLSGVNAVVAIDPLGIGTYNRLVSELNVEGRKYRGDGIVIYAEIYDKDSLVVIGRIKQAASNSNAWVYVTFDKVAGDAPRDFTDRIVKSIHKCS